MLLHEWELPREPGDQGPRRRRFDLAEHGWLLLPVLLLLVGAVSDGVTHPLLLWLGLVLIARRLWRSLDTVGSLGEWRQ